MSEMVTETWDVDYDPETAAAYVAAFECNTGSEASGIPDAVITFSPEGTQVGYGTVMGFNTALPATTAYGTGAAANIPAGENTITIEIDGEQDVYQRDLRAGHWEMIVLYPRPFPIAETDYWEDGTCAGGGTVSSTDCQDVSFEGCCDESGYVIWCEYNMLFCVDCAGIEGECGWNEEQQWYDCAEAPGGEDPSEEHPIDCP
jgi:hypothetical protein